MGNLRNPSTTDKVALWMNPVSSSLSIISSSAIIYLMISDRQVKLQKPNNRFLLLMSIFDVIQSVAYASSSIPLPVDSQIYGARGNQTTCSVQGFFIQIGFTVACYNACLCMWFLMHVKYQMSPEVFQKKIEPYCHGIAIGVPLLSGVVNLSFGLYDARGFLCWITIDQSALSTVAMVLSVATPSVSGLIIIYSVGSIYYSFLVKERKMRRYSTSASGMQWRPNHTLPSRKAAAKQGLLFSLAFFLTFTFPAINVLFLDNAEGDTTPVMLLQAIFMPLQGFWNFIIFARPTIERIMNEYPEHSFPTAFFMMIFRPSEVRSSAPRRRRSSRNRRRRRRSSNLSTASQIVRNGGRRHSFGAGSAVAEIPASVQEYANIAIMELKEEGLDSDCNSDDDVGCNDDQKVASKRLDCNVHAENTLLGEQNATNIAMIELKEDDGLDSCYIDDIADCNDDQKVVTECLDGTIEDDHNCDHDKKILGERLHSSSIDDDDCCV